MNPSPVQAAETADVVDAPPPTAETSPHPRAVLEPAAVFERERPRLFGVAYRMLGSAAEAEDVVQDAYLRWQRANRQLIAAPGAWLVKTVVNLCLNVLGSARMRRERTSAPGFRNPC
ncbi:sigma factor [Streptomyces sp. NPDC020096]